MVFDTETIPSAYPTLCCNRIRVSPKIRIISAGICSKI